jgi:hypothetical protein
MRFFELTADTRRAFRSNHELKKPRPATSAYSAPAAVARRLLSATGDRRGALASDLVNSNRPHRARFAKLASPSGRYRVQRMRRESTSPSVRGASSSPLDQGASTPLRRQSRARQRRHFENVPPDRHVRVPLRAGHCNAFAGSCAARLARIALEGQVTIIPSTSAEGGCTRDRKSPVPGQARSWARAGLRFAMGFRLVLRLGSTNR